LKIVTAKHNLQNIVSCNSGTVEHLKTNLTTNENHSWPNGKLGHRRCTDNLVWTVERILTKHLTGKKTDDAFKTEELKIWTPTRVKFDKIYPNSYK